VANKLISRENMHAILGVIMIVCLTLSIVTFFLALIWIGQPIGNMAITTADIFASIFSAAFFAAFAFAMADQRPRDSRTMSAIGTKRTFRSEPSMSAIGGRADIARKRCHVCF